MRDANFEAKPVIGSPLLPDSLQFPYGGITFRAIYDQLDNYFFPTDGSSVELKGLLAREWAGSPENSAKAAVNALKAFHIGPHNFALSVEAGKVYNGDCRDDVEPLSRRAVLHVSRAAVLSGRRRLTLNFGSYWVPAFPSGRRLRAGVALPIETSESRP